MLSYNIISDEKNVNELIILLIIKYKFINKYYYLNIYYL